MDRLSRPLLIERLRDGEEFIPGGCLLGIHFERFLTLDPREKLLLIRVWLEDMYGDEYSRVSIGNGEILSYQGLKNIEEKLRDSIRANNIERLSTKYHVPVGVITGNKPEGEWSEGLFIGKPEDRQDYFYNYYLKHGENHILDDTDYSKIHWKDATKKLHEVDVEVFIKLCDPGTGEHLTTRNVARMKVLSDDVARLHDIIVKDMDVVSHRHEEYMSMREYLDEVYQRLAAAERRIDMYEEIDTNERIERELDELMDS